jgi:hypothetical protein
MDNIVTFKWMLDGYTDAAARFDAAVKGRDPQMTYTAVFEALNWAVALDERIGTHWLPDGEPLGWKWRQRLGYGADIMGGVRFARNSVHHQWSDALRLDAGRSSLPSSFPVPFHEWIWRPADELPEPDQKPHPDNERIYRQQMEGRPVRVCLDVLNGAFFTLGRLLEPHTIRSGWDPADLPFPAPEPPALDPA